MKYKCFLCGIPKARKTCKKSNEICGKLFKNAIACIFEPILWYVSGGLAVASQKPKSWMYNFVEVFDFWQFSDLRFPYTMFTLHTSFKPLLLKAGGGLKSVSRSDCDCNLSQLRLRIRPQRQILYCSRALHFKRKVTKIVSPSTVQAHLFLQKVQKVWKG